MFRRRYFVALAVTATLLGVAARPAEAGDGLVQKKSVSGPNGRKGSFERFQEKSGSKVSNYVRLTAVDSDGAGGKCTETWVDYSTSPHEHWNPAVLVNCSGGSRTITGMTNNGKTIRSMQLIVCEVPETSGRITRNKSNCRGQIGAMYLHSGQPYSRFDVSADQYPSGIQVYR